MVAPQFAIMERRACLAHVLAACRWHSRFSSFLLPLHFWPLKLKDILIPMNEHDEIYSKNSNEALITIEVS
jgi:hypothetical protein